MSAVMEQIDVVYLVCEGRCNGGRVETYDAIVLASARRWDAGAECRRISG